jgi:hypothetical protein
MPRSSHCFFPVPLSSIGSANRYSFDRLTDPTGQGAGLEQNKVSPSLLLVEDVFLLLMRLDVHLLQLDHRLEHGSALVVGILRPLSLGTACVPSHPRPTSCRSVVFCAPPPPLKRDHMAMMPHP